MVQKNMKSNEFITEAKKKKKKKKKIPIISQELIKVLHKQCGEYLGNATAPLYRGFGRELPGLAKVPIRKNRVPKDSESIDTAAFNYVFEMYTGVKHIRNITTFAAMNYMVAQSYGRLGMIFPLNGTQYVRSTKIKDLYSEFDEKDAELEDVANEFIYKNKLNNFQEEKLLQVVWDAQDYMETSRGIISKAEIHKAFGKALPLWTKFVRYFEKLVKSFYLYDGFHPELNKAKEEIAMFGKPFYYALDVEKIEDEIVEFVVDEDYRVYVGGEELSRTPKDMYALIFNAIKNGEEIYAVKVSDKFARFDF